MVLEKRKSFTQKSGTKRSLCRLQPRLLHVMLDELLKKSCVVLIILVFSFDALFGLSWRMLTHV
jgi:hypothetical protein